VLGSSTDRGIRRVPARADRLRSCRRRCRGPGGEPVRIPLAGRGKLNDPQRNKFGYLNSRARGKLKPGAHSVKRLVHGLNAFGLESEIMGSGPWHHGVADVCSRVAPDLSARYSSLPTNP
jgi:hypothetical protein